MERIGLDICVMYNEKSFIYRKICKRVVCSRYEKCGEHDIIGLKTLLREYKDDSTPGCMEA